MFAVEGAKTRRGLRARTALNDDGAHHVSAWAAEATRLGRGAACILWPRFAQLANSSEMLLEGCTAVAVVVDTSAQDPADIATLGWCSVP